MSQQHQQSAGGRALTGLAAAALLLAGCRGLATRPERQARADLASVTRVYRPEGRRVALPKLSPDASLGDFLRYAMLNQPEVEAAYFDWAAAVQRITVNRSLPDPQLTFQMDIGSVISSVMPGLMEAFPGRGKLRLRAAAASAESQARYSAFERAVLGTAFALKRAYYRLWFLGDKLQIEQETLRLLRDLETSARAENAVGKVTLQDVYRAQIEEDRLSTEIANLEDLRHPLLAEFKAALGMTRDEPDPPMPQHFQSTPLDLSGQRVLDAAFARNPRLKAAEADVRQAEATLELAYKAKVPDFGLGLMADAQMSPTVYRPQAGLTLPLWRDKIAAGIAAAQASKRAAEARLGAEQVRLTADFALKAYDYREVTRDLALLENRLVPKARQSLEIARAGYLAGRIDFFNLIDAERTWLNFRLQEVAARTRRELVLADLSLTIAGLPPEGAPALPSSPEVSAASTKPPPQP
jgi:outer membrane protein, heavy metal efflux system